MAAAAVGDGVDKQPKQGTSSSSSSSSSGAPLQIILIVSSVLILVCWTYFCSFQLVRVFWAWLASDCRIDLLSSHHMLKKSQLTSSDFTKGSLVQALSVERRAGETGVVFFATESASAKAITVDFGSPAGPDLVEALKPEQLLLVRQGEESGRMPQWYPAPQPERQAGQATTVKRIVAFGDSLTAGFHTDRRSHFTPYAPALVKGLLPEVIADAWVNGMSAALALEMLDQMDWTETVDCVQRLGVGMRRLLQDKRPIDLLLILAGTNDLHHRMPPEKIASSVTKLHEASHAMGVPTVMLSIPPSKFVSESLYGESWRETNGLLHAWAKQKLSAGSSGTVGLAAYVNTSAIMPYGAGDSLFDRDGLHFTDAGSNRFGERLSEILKDLLLI